MNSVALNVIGFLWACEGGKGGRQSEEGVDVG